MKNLLRTRSSESIRSNRFQKSVVFERRKIFPVLLLLALVFLFAGCGASQPGTRASKAPTFPPSNAVTSTTTVSAASPAPASEEELAEISEEAPAQTQVHTTTEAVDASAGALSPDPEDFMDPEASSPTDSNAPSPEPSSPETGIIVKSGNELSSEEKQALLEELEKELDALFAEINDVSEEEEMESQN